MFQNGDHTEQEIALLHRFHIESHRAKNERKKRENQTKCPFEKCKSQDFA